MKKVSCPYLKYFFNTSSDLYGMNNNLVRNLKHLKTLYCSLQFPLTVTCLVLSLFILRMCLLVHLNLDFLTLQVFCKMLLNLSRDLLEGVRKRRKSTGIGVPPLHIFGEALQKMEDFVLFYEVSARMSCTEWSEYCRCLHDAML